MGLFDEVVLDPPLLCAGCGAAIAVVQTHAFEDTLARYRVGDCVGHAEELRVVREDLWCEACRQAADQKFVYLVVVRGILVGVEESFEGAQQRLRAPCLEELVLWYHDLDRRRRRAETELRNHRRFLERLQNHLANGTAASSPRLPTLWDRYFEGAGNTREVVERFLDDHPMTDDDVAGF